MHDERVTNPARQILDQSRRNLDRIESELDRLDRSLSGAPKAAELPQQMLLNRREAAQVLGIDVRTLDTLAQNGEVRRHKPSGMTRFRYARVDLEAYALGKTKETAA